MVSKLSISTSDLVETQIVRDLLRGLVFKCPAKLNVLMTVEGNHERQVPVPLMSFKTCPVSPSDCLL